MATKKDKHKELIDVCTQVKRNIKNKFNNGTANKITKTEAYDMISKRLGLASSRTLWKSGERKIYLDTWFIKLETELAELNDNNKATDKLNNRIDIISHIDKTNDINTSTEKLNNALKLIKEYEKAIKALREENDELRAGLIPRYGKIDK